MIATAQLRLISLLIVSCRAAFLTPMTHTERHARNVSMNYADTPVVSRFGSNHVPSAAYPPWEVIWTGNAESLTICEIGSDETLTGTCSSCLRTPPLGPCGGAVFWYGSEDGGEWSVESYDGSGCWCKVDWPQSGCRTCSCDLKCLEDKVATPRAV
jgi:hypothetical protein